MKEICFSACRHWRLLLFSVCGKFVHLSVNPLFRVPLQTESQFVTAYGRSEWVNYLHANHTLRLKLHFFNWGRYKGIIKRMCSNWMRADHILPALDWRFGRFFLPWQIFLIKLGSVCRQWMWPNNTHIFCIPQKLKRHLAPIVLLLFFICTSTGTDAFCAVKLIN